MVDIYVQFSDMRSPKNLPRFIQGEFNNNNIYYWIIQLLQKKIKMLYLDKN